MDVSGGVPGIWKLPIHGIILKIPGDCDHSIILQIDASYFEYVEGTEVVGKNVADNGA